MAETVTSPYSRSWIANNRATGSGPGAICRSKAPLRISFTGGGTDFPHWFDAQPGAVLCCTINRYAYATLYPRTDEEVHLHSVDLGRTVQYSINQEPMYDGVLDLAKAARNLISDSYVGVEDRWHAGVDPGREVERVVELTRPDVTSLEIDVPALGSVVCAQRRRPLHGGRRQLRRRDCKVPQALVSCRADRHGQRPDVGRKRPQIQSASGEVRRVANLEVLPTGSQEREVLVRRDDHVDGAVRVALHQRTG